MNMLKLAGLDNPPPFVRGFIEECFNLGLTEEQALELLCNQNLIELSRESRQSRRGECGGTPRLDSSGRGLGNQGTDNQPPKKEEK